MILFKMAWANLFRNRKRNALSLIAVLFGFLGMSVFFDYVFWAEKWMTTISVYLNHNGHVMVYKDGMLDKFFTKPRRYLINPELQAKVADLARQDPRVEYVGRYLKGMGLVTHGQASTGFLANGVDLSIEDKLQNHPQVQQWAREFVQMQYHGNLWGHPEVKNPVAVTARLAQLIGFSPSIESTDPPASKAPATGDIQLVATSFEGALSAQDAGVVSRFSTGQALSEDTALLTSLETLQKLYDTEGVSSMAIYLKDRSELGGFYRDFTRKLADAQIPLKATPYYEESVSPFYVGVTQFIYSAAAFFLLLVSTVVVISLANTISMTVVERTREIGTLRSIGYLPQHVNRLFLIEGVLLVSIGLLTGFAANYGLAFLVNHYTNFRFAPPGIAGDAQFLIITNNAVSAVLAAVFVVIGAAAVYAVVRRRTQLPVAHLFQSAAH
jgi:putative ABC transport system permease protein